MSAIERIEWNAVQLVDRLPWKVARAVLLYIDFHDGTWAIGFKRSKRVWMIA